MHHSHSGRGIRVRNYVRRPYVRWPSFVNVTEEKKRINTTPSGGIKQTKYFDRLRNNDQTSRDITRTHTSRHRVVSCRVVSARHFIPSELQHRMVHSNGRSAGSGQ